MVRPRPSRPSLSARWLVPAGTAAAVGLAVVGSHVGPAGADPVLPERTATDLLASVADAQVPGLSGTVATSSSLGLPSLGAMTGASSTGPTTLASGEHTLRVWAAGTDRSRVTIDERMAEYSVVRRGQEVWTYDSSQDAVTHATLPAHGDRDRSLLTAATPQQAAQAALAAVDPSTEVTVDRATRVAGRAAYQLVLTPRDARSLVGSVRLALDSETSVPLRVQVFARGAQSPALQVGFTSVDLGVPDASTFAVPTGSTTKERTRPQRDEAPSGPRPTDVTTTGTAWTTVVSATGVTVPPAAAPLVAQATSAVTVDGVQGRLLRTALVSALLMDDGRAFVGAVTPETLTAAAAR